MAKNPKKPLSPSKKHLARLERERLQRRYILIGSAVVLIAVVGILVYGMLDQTVLKARKPVAVVNGQNITTEDYQGQVRYARYSLIQNAQQTAQFMQLFGSDPSTASQFVGQLQQIKLQLEPSSIGKTVVDQMVDNDLIRQYAKANGITVTEDELNKAFQEAFGYFANGTPTPTATTESFPTSTLSALQMTLVPPTATPTQEITATAALTGTQSATTGTPSASAPVTATATVEFTPTPTGVITPTATPTITPTPTPYTLEGYQKVSKETIDNFKTKYGITEKDLRYIIESSLYREKVMKAVIGDLSHTQEQVWARHILVQDEQAAKEVETRLSNGEDFCKIAAEVSQDTSNKNNCGDLSWFAKDKMDPKFADAAWALKVGEISQPVQSSFGWHVIQALGHEERPLSVNDYDQLRQQKFQDWLTAQKNAAKITIKDNYVDLAPTEPTLPAEIDQIIQQASSQIPQSSPNIPQPTP